MYADTNTTPLCSRPSKKDLQLARFFVAKLTSLLVYANPKVYFFSLLSLISSVVKTKKHERGHSREITISVLSYLLFLFSFFLNRFFFVMYIDEYTHEYTYKLV